jgi:hypothetical protein
VARVVPHAGHALDHGGDAGQRPEFGQEAAGARALAQYGLHGREIRRRDLGLPARPPGAPETRPTPRGPGSMPAHHALAADPQTAGDRAIGLGPGGKQPGRGEPPVFQALEIASGTRVRIHGPRLSYTLTNVTLICEAQ